MFDNLNANKQQNQGGNTNEDTNKLTNPQQNNSGQSGQPNIPQQQEQTDLKTINQKQDFNKQQIAEDIFAEVDKNAGEQVIESLNRDKSRPEFLQPRDNKSITQIESEIAASLEEGSGGVVKKIILGVAVALILTSIAYGGFWFYNNYYKNGNIIIKEEPVPEESIDTNKTHSPSINTDNVKNDNTAQKQATQSKTKPEIQDTDQDGLTDQEERELGTNIYKIDSDGDGLFDREEIKTYKTDPLNPDTDGDGYLDGQEVKAGYNPLGSGKLYEINK